MAITHHADGATLMSYAAGSLPEALSAVVATHVAMCPQCRKELATLDELGAVFLAGLPGEAASMPQPREPALDPARSAASIRPAAATAGTLPPPLTRLVGTDLNAIAWKRLGLGVWHLPLPLSPNATGDLRLIKVAPGQVMPEHGHGGTELSLILAGSYTDSVGHFGYGDLSDLDEAIEHQPIADHKTGCICLIASEHPARFKSLLARLVQPFVGL
jgi:putative transcriptional regulator